MKKTSSILLGKDIAIGFVEGVQGSAEGSRRVTEKFFQSTPALETLQCRKMLNTVLSEGVSVLFPTLLVGAGCLVELTLLNFHVSDPGLPAAAG